MYLFGVTGLIAIQGLWQFGLQIVIMVALAMLLYGWLLTGRYAEHQIMLLEKVHQGLGEMQQLAPWAWVI